MKRAADLLMFLFFFLAASKVDNQIHHSGALAGYGLMFGLLAGWVLISSLDRSEPLFLPAPRPQRVVPVMAMLAVVISSYFNASDTSLLIVFGVHILYVPFFYFFFDRRERVRLFLKAFVLAGIVNSVINVIQFVSPHLLTLRSSSMEISQELRSAGFYINANESGFYLTIAFLAVIWLVREGVLRQWFGLVLQAILVMGIVVTFSRGAFLLLALLLLFSLLAQRKYSIIAFGVIIGLSLYLAQDLLVPTSNATTGYVMRNRLDLTVMLDNLKHDGRVSITRAAWDSLVEQPLHVRGYMSFRADFGGGPHNEFLMLWGGAGLLACLFYLWSLASALKQGLLSVRTESVLPLALGILLVLEAFASHNLLEHNQYVILLVLAIRGPAGYAHRPYLENAVLS